MGRWDKTTLSVPKSLYKVVVSLMAEHGLGDEAVEVEENFTRYSSSSHNLDVDEFPVGLLKALLPHFAAYKESKSLLDAYIRILENPRKSKIGKLQLLPALLYKYFADDATDGWVYMTAEGGENVAYVVEEAEYHSGSRDSGPYVTLSLMYNQPKMGDPDKDRKSGLTYKRFTWDSHDIVGKTVEELLMVEGIYKETPELRAEYDAYFELFGKYVVMQGLQFTVNGNATSADNSGYSYREQLYTPVPDAKMVNDEELCVRNIQGRCSNYRWQSFIKGLTEEDRRFSRVPVHPYLLMFDLQTHDYAWVHVGNVEPYEYDAAVREKLVLQQTHRDLIDILTTTDLDVFSDQDIIRGKSGGICILCYGKPGLGKTLTAEVYSELIQRPLYRVHAGALGISIEDVEKNLQIVMRRAERWKAILLLDEADVYIAKRGDDLERNAVVAAFLRTMEYFNGLMFMTTNRIEDVDDAIVSRMIALFRYDLPDVSMSEQLWKILGTQFGWDLTPKHIAALMAQFSDENGTPTLSGRDIKQLIRLTKKYCVYHKKPINMDAFRICAMFRGLQ